MSTLTWVAVLAGAVIDSHLSSRRLSSPGSPVIGGPLTPVAALLSPAAPRSRWWRCARTARSSR